jgi:hypothetical protein
MLIDAGADVNHRNKAGKSALDVAMSNDVRNHDAAVALLEAGAEVGEGKKVFKSIRKCECTSNHPIVMRWCKENGLKHSRVAYCLDDEVVEGNRNMFYSCEEGYYSKHSMRGGCGYARDEYGQRMLMCNMGSWRSFCYAVSYDDFDVNCYPDCNGRTLLHHAVLGGSRKVLREVLKKGPDATAVDKKGRTALMMVQRERYGWMGASDDDESDDDASEDAVDGDADDYDDEEDDESEEEDEGDDETMDDDDDDDEEEEEEEEEEAGSLQEEDDTIDGDDDVVDKDHDDTATDHAVDEDDCYDEDDDEDLEVDEDDEYDGDDDSDADCWTHWDKDPLNVRYGKKDSLVEMLVKYMCAKEAARQAKAGAESAARANAAMKR